MLVIEVFAWKESDIVCKVIVALTDFANYAVVLNSARPGKGRGIALLCAV